MVGKHIKAPPILGSTSAVRSTSVVGQRLWVGGWPQKSNFEICSTTSQKVLSLALKFGDSRIEK